MSWSDVMRLVQFYVKSIFLRIFPIATATVGWLWEWLFLNLRSFRIDADKRETG